MNTDIIFMFAIGVFVLMAVGIVLTMQEFNRISEEPSQRKGPGSGVEKPNAVKATTPPKPAPRPTNAKSGERANMRVVH